jgi:hypothetical protein
MRKLGDIFALILKLMEPSAGFGPATITYQGDVAPQSFFPTVGIILSGENYDN